MDHQRTPT